MGAMPIDFGHVQPDMGAMPIDFGHVQLDMGAMPVDFGHVQPDMGAMPIDFGHVQPDMGAMQVDSGTCSPTWGRCRSTWASLPPDMGAVDMGVAPPDMGPVDMGVVPPDMAAVDMAVPASRGRRRLRRGRALRRGRLRRVPRRGRLRWRRRGLRRAGDEGLCDVVGEPRGVIPGVNRPPVFLTEPDTAAAEGESWRYAPQVDDLDGDSLTFSLAVAPPAMRLSGETGALFWRPGDQDAGAHSVELVVQDAAGAQARQAFVLVVEARNEAPCIVSSPPRGGGRGGLALSGAGPGRRRRRPGLRPRGPPAWPSTPTASPPGSAAPSGPTRW
ncbi:MAG: putative Ig domain-containing protein [bacterium]